MNLCLLLFRLELEMLNVFRPFLVRGLGGVG
jgi:hypothetical protein